MSTREAAHVDALWWLFTVGGYSKTLWEPGDREFNQHDKAVVRTDFGLILGHAETHTARLFRAPTREELLDQLVAFTVERRLTQP